MAFANLPALTADELTVLEEILQYQIHLQASQAKAKMPPKLDRNVLRSLLLAVREAQGRVERRVVRENAARVPEGDLQEAFVDEARSSMGQPDRLDIERLVGKEVCITLNHSPTVITGFLTAVDRTGMRVEVAGQSIPLRAIQSISEAPGALQAALSPVSPH